MEHYYLATFSVNINAVCSPLYTGWASRMGVPGSRWGWGGWWDLLKKTLIYQTETVKL